MLRRAQVTDRDHLPSPDRRTDIAEHDADRLAAELQAAYDMLEDYDLMCVDSPALKAHEIALKARQ